MIDVLIHKCFPHSREELNVDLPDKGKYATGVVYMESLRSAETEKAFEKEAEEDGLKVLCWRTVPTDSTFLGNVARSTEPYMRQVSVRSAMASRATCTVILLVLFVRSMPVLLYQSI